MTLDELRRLDPNKIGSWPVLPKLLVLLGVLLAILGAAYWFVWKDQIDQNDAERAKTEQLKTTFLDKKKVAIDLPAYRKQLDDIEKQFGALLKQLPGKSEMDALLTDINQAGLGRGLEFELFKPGQETQAEFYAQMPISIKVQGTYHELGAFATDISKLSRMILTMEAVAKTYRYLDADELAAKKKADQASLLEGKR